MLQPIVNPTPKVKGSESTYNKSDDPWQEFMAEINYGYSKVASKKWTLAEYYDYMADFFDYLGLPSDAQELKDLASKWMLENSEI